MRATAKVQIQVSMLTVANVKMGTAIEAGEKISFSQLHSECQSKVQQKLHCPKCSKDIVDKAAEIIKGYPLEKDRFVTLTDAEIESCQKDSTDVIKILQFVEEKEIPEIYHESASYLWTEKEGNDSYSLFWKLLTDCHVVALGKVVMRNKDHFLAIRPYGNVLIAYNLYFPAQIRETKEIEQTINADAFDEDTMSLAKALVTKMKKPFAPEEIKDEYTEALRAIIQTKASGNIIDITEKKTERKVINLKDSLAASLKEAA